MSTVFDILVKNCNEFPFAATPCALKLSLYKQDWANEWVIDMSWGVTLEKDLRNFVLYSNFLNCPRYFLTEGKRVAKRFWVSAKYRVIMPHQTQQRRTHIFLSIFNGQTKGFFLNHSVGLWWIIILFILGSIVAMCISIFEFEILRNQSNS